MRLKQKNILWLLIIFLVSCQTNKFKLNDNDSSYSLAVKSHSSLQPAKYVPVPMPGQLMALKPSGGSKPLEGEAAIDAANKKSVKQPTSGEYINSIMTFDYMPGALYQIYAAPLRVTDIQFQSNEHIVAVGAGDTMRWQVNKTYSGGAGANRQEHLLIKPIEEGLSNSLVITTDQRTYHLMLHSTPKTYMASVAWRYPDSEGLMTKLDDTYTPGEIGDLANSVDINHLNFNYQVKLIKGQQPDWYPRMVFNDGAKTYIKFSNQTQESPTLFISDGKNNQIVNYRVQGNYYVVDSIVYQAQLRGGINNKTVIQIAMKKR